MRKRWTPEHAWKWYNAQPWIRGCNYMPASAANRVDQWQELGSEERFAEVDRELALAEKVGFNTLVMTNINAEMDAERGGESVRAKIAAKFTITDEDMWFGYRRTKFDFHGREAWVVEPTVAACDEKPWTWTMQWAEAFVDRTGVLDLLREGFHHVTIDLFPTRMDEAGIAAAAAFQAFLTEELGFARKANLVGMSWGGFFSMRYAATHPDNVRRVYLDAPLLTFAGFGDPSPERIGPWAASMPAGGWESDPRMPVNLSEKLAKAGIPVLLLYGGQDQTVSPEKNAEAFLDRFKAAGGVVEVENRSLFGHHPHGVDPNKTARIVEFFRA